MQYVSHRSSSIPVLVSSFALLASLACAASKDARPSPGVEELPPAGRSIAAATQQGVAGTASSTPPATSTRSTTSTSTTASSTASKAGKDSAAKGPMVTVP